MLPNIKPVYLLVLVSLSFAQNITPEEVPLRWAELNLELIAKSRFLSPPAIARSIAKLATAMYEAITPYTYNLWPSIDLGIAKRPAVEQIDQNRVLALSYAAYRVITHTFAAYPQLLDSVENFAETIGIQTTNYTWGVCSEGFGNKISENLISRRATDRTNEYGTNPGSMPYGVPFSDDTNYFPINDPQPTPGRTNCSQLRSMNHWQPLRVPTRTGGSVVQRFACAQCGKAIGFALTNPYQFMPPGPPIYGSSSQFQFVSQFEEVVDMQAHLTDEHKIIVEYWADGPGSSSGPPGHWHSIAIRLCRTRQLSLVSAVKLLFLHGNAVFDAGIAVWAAKRLYDSVRPITAIQCLKAGTTILGWLGPYRGIGPIDGNNWRPFQDPYILTPPFADYVSGHSAFSSASAEVLKRFFCSDTFGETYIAEPGSSMFEGKISNGSLGYVAGLTDVPNTGPGTPGYVPASRITLRWATFTEAAEQAGLSRMYGGIHIRASNVDGAELGRNVGGLVWTRFNNLVGNHVCNSI